MAANEKMSDMCGNVGVEKSGASLGTIQEEEEEEDADEAVGLTNYTQLAV